MSEKIKEIIGEGWYNHLSHFIESEKFKKIGKQLKESKEYVPKGNNIFKAFNLCKWNDVKVIIIGYDPYYTLTTSNETGKQIPLATGLSFGIPNETLYTPPSLENIRNEIEREYDALLLNNFDYSLESWAKQGVLMLNTSLTVELNSPTTHIYIWKEFTKEVIQILNEKKIGLIWILWGEYVKKLDKYINSNIHYILKSGDPSPSAANKGLWYGNNHFKQINNIIMNQNGVFDIIKWFPTMELDKAKF